MNEYNFWKWIPTGTVYQVNRDCGTVRVVYSDTPFDKVGVVKSLRDMKSPSSDAGKLFKVYRYLEEAVGGK